MVSQRGCFLYSLAVLDEYPHILLLIASIGIGMYILLFRKDCLLFAKYNAFKLWPAVVAIGVLGVQLWIIQDTVADYIPSQRPSLAIDPRHLAPRTSHSPLRSSVHFCRLGCLSAQKRWKKALQTGCLLCPGWLSTTSLIHFFLTWGLSLLFLH